MMEENQSPTILVDVVENGTRTRSGSHKCVINHNIRFTTSKLETYCFATWKPVVYDALLLAAAIEYCDRIKLRPAYTWRRDFRIKISVHDPGLWNRPIVSDALHDALQFLTGDHWQITFSKRNIEEECPREPQFDLSSNLEAVIPFSDGIDSLAVAELTALGIGDRLIRVRLGPKTVDRQQVIGLRKPFTVIPYSVRPNDGERFVESSGRSRGFKFMLISGLAAYLIGVQRVIVPESGQGVFGPSLVKVGQAYGDFRNHPFFTLRMEKFLNALLGKNIKYEFPRLWYTKGQTIIEFNKKCSPGNFPKTSSCWQGARQVSVEKKKRQCGICAACMLRRMSFHAAGLKEPVDTYVWENLNAPSFKEGIAISFDPKKITVAQRQYMIAGALHLEHLARFRNSVSGPIALDNLAYKLSESQNLAVSEIRSRLDSLLVQHEKEWDDFLNSLNPNSFLMKWVEPKI